LVREGAEEAWGPDGSTDISTLLSWAEVSLKSPGWRALEEGARLRATALLGLNSSGLMRPWRGLVSSLEGDAEEPLGDLQRGSTPWLPAPCGPAMGMNMLWRAPTPGTVLGLARWGRGLGPSCRWLTGEKASAGVPLLLPDSDTSMLAASILAASKSSAEVLDLRLLEPPMLPSPGLGVTSPSEEPRKRAEPPYVLVAGRFGWLA
jgi:hypothetical protein